MKALANEGYRGGHVYDHLPTDDPTEIELTNAASDTERAAIVTRVLQELAATGYAYIAYIPTAVSLGLVQPLGAGATEATPDQYVGSNLAETA